MKRILHLALLPMTLSTVALSGCAMDEAPVDCQPGDIDCSTDEGGDGKADSWDYANDPSRLANNMNYRIDELPKAGKLDKPVWKNRFPEAPSDINVMWTETYFPSSRGSTNNRWLGSTVASPLEKYDQVFNGKTAAAQPSARCGEGAKAEWDTYFASAGPAAKWHEQNFHGMINGHNGRDDDNNGQTDECSGGQNGYGADNTPAGWWGLCHAWTPAAMLEPEAINPVTVDGVTFERSDIHALVMTVYDANNARMLGGRCNNEEFSPDNTSSANNACADTNPGAMHVVLSNFLGVNDTAIAFDRTSGVEVWNQPIYSYDVTQMNEVSATDAMRCVGGTGDTYTHNTSATKLYDTRLTVTYLVEGDANKRVLDMDDYLSSDDYHYILEVGSTGKVIGGRYCTGSEGPDFMWAPTGPSESSWAKRNPNVSLAKVRELLSKSVAGGDNAGGGGTGTDGNRVEDVAGVTIPDNNATGISRALSISGATGTAVTVNLDISHSYIGDLTVRLLKDGAVVGTLHAEAGGSADNIVQSYPLTVSGSANGAYILEVVDGAAQDEGTLNKWSLGY